MKTSNVLLIVTLFLMAACGNPAVIEDVPPPPQVEEAAVSEEAPAAEEEPAAEADNPEPAAEGSIFSAFTAPVTVSSGEVIFVYGQVMDTAGNPLEGTSVEFWQTDWNGVYDHPNDPGTSRRDMGFQFYGTAITDADGSYIFRTIKPTAYEGRPPHIHVKVKLQGRELLTSQFYFVEESAANAADGLSANANDTQLLDLVENADAGTRVAVANIVFDTGSGGSLVPTRRDGEGPYYPVVDVAEFDNDLASVE